MSNTSAFMGHAQLLADTKRNIIEAVKAKHGTEMNDLAIQRKAATFFYDFAKHNLDLNRATTRQLVGIYERFGAFELRSKLENLFGIGELAALTGKSDEIVKLAISIKETNPDMPRSELLARLV